MTRCILGTVSSICDGTSGSFLGCLWEVRNTVESWGASWDSTGFGAMEQGLISSWGENLRVTLLFWHGCRAVYAISNRESGLDECEGIELCFPLEWSKGFQASSWVEFGTWGSFLISNQGIGTPFVLRVDYRPTFELVEGNQAWSLVDGEISGFRIVTRPPGSPPVSSRYQPPLEVRRRWRHSFVDEAGQSTLILTWGRENGALVDF